MSLADEGASGVTIDILRGEATEEEAAIIRVIADVWLSALVGWVTGRSEATDVEKQIDVAVRLLLR